MTVYLADVHPLENAERFGDLYRRMPPERQAKIDRYRFPEDRLLSLGAGALLQTALTEAGIPDGVPAVSSTGKPFLQNYPDCCFSLSHSGTRVLCAVSHTPVGCDLEKLKEPPLQLVPRICAPEEQQLLDNQNGLMQSRLFYLLWVGKESYLKMTGEGLRRSLASVSVKVPLGVQEVQGRRVAFREIPCGDGYCGAVCTEDTGDVPIVKTLLL